MGGKVQIFNICGWAFCTQRWRWIHPGGVRGVHPRRGVLEQLRRVLKDLQIRTVMRPHKTLRQMLVHLKDPLPDMERSNVVYRIPCAEYPATYVGETKRKLCKRIDEHKRALRMCDCNASAVAEHVWNAGHHVDWSGVTILDLDQNLHRRLNLEACHIRMQPSPVNRDRGSLPPVYDHLLKHSQSHSHL